MSSTTAEDDADWLSPEADPHADTERAPALRPYVGKPRVWLFAGPDDQDPRGCSSLIEATGEPPVSPDAEVFFKGQLLAQADDEVPVWTFTHAGMKRLADEARGTLERDHDVVLSIVLRDDLRQAVGS